MSKYRRKPMIVEAVRWDGTEASGDFCRLLGGVGFEVLEPPGWNDDVDVTAICKSDLRGQDWVPMYQGDYVVVDDEGRLYPMRGVLFEGLFESWIGCE